MIYPIEAELAILQILWDRNEASVKEVHDIRNQNRQDEKAYTTTLKTLQIMTEKGFVLRDAEGRKHIYRAAIRKEDTQRHLLRELILSAYSGSATAMVLQALGSSKPSEEELAEIRAIIDQMQSKK